MAKAPSPTPQYAELEIRLNDGSYPCPYPCWRKIAVDYHTPLDELHDIFQAAMGWFDNHLWLMDLGLRSTQWVNPDAGWEGLEEYQADGRTVRLSDLPKKFRYVYDMGDNWKHAVTVKKVVAGEHPSLLLPALINGKGRCPPEDVGGVSGLARFLAVMAKGSGAEFKHARDWYGEVFDQDNIDRQMIKWRLRAIMLAEYGGRGRTRMRITLR